MKFYFNNNCYNKYKTVYDIKEQSFYIPKKTGQYVIEFEKTVSPEEVRDILIKVVDLPIDPQLMGALGAAEFARQKGMAKK